MKRSPERPYKILMLAPTMFFADYGCHVRIYEEAMVLTAMGHHVTILAYPNGRDLGGLDVRRSKGVPFNYRIVVGSSRHKIYLDFMLALKSLFHVIIDKPDIIHAHLHEGGLLGWFLSKLTGAPLVFDFQGSLTSEMLDHKFITKDSFLFNPLRRLEKRINRMGQAVLTSSQHGAAILKEDGVSPGRIHPTPDCVNPDSFNPQRYSNEEKAALKQKLNLPAEKQLLVYAGLLTEYQGVGLLLHALQNLSVRRDDFHLLLMGFPAEAYYQKLANKLGIGPIVTFTGKMPYENLPVHLALGDIAMAPKLSNTEGNGKILNYISMALPTVAFKTPVSQEYLGQHGIYAQKKTAPALAEAIERILDMSPAEKRQLGRTVRNRAKETFTWTRIGQQIEVVYDAVLSGDPQPAQTVKKAAMKTVRS